MISLFTGQVWKAATVGAGVITLILTALLISTYFENRDLLHQRSQLVAQISDPKTGYVAQLSQARTNVATLTTQLNTQRMSFELKAKEREKVLADTEAQLVIAQAKTHNMEVKLDSFLATKPQGATLEARIHDIDARGMKDMVE